jgi:hypothetical protein
MCCGVLQSTVKSCCEPERVYETDVRERARAMRREVSSVLQRQVVRRESAVDGAGLHKPTLILTVPKHDILVRYSIADFHNVTSKSVRVRITEACDIGRWTVKCVCSKGKLNVIFWDLLSIQWPRDCS